MPLYEYKCDSDLCGRIFDRSQAWADAETAKCPYCRGNSTRRFNCDGAGISIPLSFRQKNKLGEVAADLKGGTLKPSELTPAAVRKIDPEYDDHVVKTRQRKADSYGKLKERLKDRLDKDRELRMDVGGSRGD